MYGIATNVAICAASTKSFCRDFKLSMESNVSHHHHHHHHHNRSLSDVIPPNIQQQQQQQGLEMIGK